MTVISLTFDGRSVQTESDRTILDIILELGIDLPHLCKDPDQPPLATCRTCLVEIQGRSGIHAACITPAEPGLGISTQSAEAARLRRGVLQLTVDALQE